MNIGSLNGLKPPTVHSNNEQNTLGLIIYQGEYFERDIPIENEWWEKAENQGYGELNILWEKSWLKVETLRKVVLKVSNGFSKPQ
ncbi:hypothetical protein OH460_09100 [Vibrio sp. Makdt]|uniref:hypothetical protein n=1 Tax=Vibrio sp. Makdt TaxID=2998828 RepID=UPI0022CD48F6|nr:hypothetical protein [Vibrio sp. Makdt]MDA0152459.1 hypothetical protein [Vibrio sp. Makdt]